MRSLCFSSCLLFLFYESWFNSCNSWFLSWRSPIILCNYSFFLISLLTNRVTFYSIFAIPAYRQRLQFTSRLMMNYFLRYPSQSLASKYCAAYGIIESVKLFDFAIIFIHGVWTVKLVIINLLKTIQRKIQLINIDQNTTSFIFFNRTTRCHRLRKLVAHVNSRVQT